LRYVYGYPDVGLLGLSEMAAAVRRLTAACNIPIFADADTGYGNAVNVYHTVQAYIRAGAAGCTSKIKTPRRNQGHSPDGV
jgi:2-methylisocitrate lyase-like PEP mutase family enzyme